MSDKPEAKRQLNDPGGTNKNKKPKLSIVDTHPDIAAQWHPSENGDLLPKDVSAGSGKKCSWICEKGHDSWQAKVYNRTSGHGCPTCYKEPDVSLLESHPDIAAQWHPSENGDLLPNDVSAGSNKKCWWICEKGHPWQAVVKDRTKGKGCRTCYKEPYVSLLESHPDIAAQWHPSKNGDLLPKDVSAGSNKKCWWICEKGHPWQTRVYHRTYGQGCPTCYKEPYVSLLESHPDIAAQWHPTENGDLLPKDVSAGSHKKCSWICEKGHDSWQAKVYSRTSGNGCPTCRDYKVHIATKKYLQSHPLVKCIHAEYKIKVWDLNAGKHRNLKVDFLVELNTGECFGFEADGPTHFTSSAHHSSPTKFRDQISRDLAKERYFREKEIHFLRVPHPEYRRIKHHLGDFVSKVSDCYEHMVCFVRPDMYFSRDEEAESLGFVV
jgi:hypothetical protein